MAYYQEKDGDRRLFMYDSQTHMNVETDESLYFNDRSQQFFIVKAQEYNRLPVSPSHEVENVTAEQALALASDNVEWRQQVQACNPPPQP